jgi:hypothetical protein
MDVIWGKREAISFFRQDWTGGIALIPRENSFSVVIPGRRASGEPGIHLAVEHVVKWIPGSR